jgi:glycosyltransferase involved in cell wall biosynthesis
VSTRVLHVVRSLRRETGGLAEAVRNLSQAQRHRGDWATIVSLDPADEGDATHVVLGRRSHGYGYSPAFVPWLRTRAREFDAVIVHGLWQYQGFATRNALRGTATPYLVFPHGMLDVWFKRAHPLKHAKKWLYWPWADYRVLRDAAAVCFTAEEERVRSRRSFWLYRAKERIAPIGIEAPKGNPEQQRAAFRAAHPALGARSFVLFLGRVHPKKGVDLLLRAYAAVHGKSAGAPVLAIAGPCDDPAYRDSLQAEAKRLGIEGAITWLPMLTGDVKWGALRACEAFALFSHQENFRVAIVEALACGRPVLLSDQIAICREIESDGAGMIGPDTAEGAAAVLSRWRDASLETRAAMGAAAHACFALRYEIGRAAETLAALIDEVKARR